MDTVVTLIASPAAQPMDADIIIEIGRLLGSPDAPDVLSPGEAHEWHVRVPDPDTRNAIERAIRAKIGHVPIDVAVTSGEGRRKRVLIADMDSTIIGQECIDELADVAGIGDKIKAITERAMRGELRFEEALRERVSLMAGLSASAITEVLATRITLTAGAQTLVHTMKTGGAHCALVSGGFTQFVAHVADLAGFDRHQANDLVIENGRLTGAVREPILGQNAKAQALARLSDELGIAPSQCLAVGDGANDIAMVRAAGLGVALHAKPALREAADVRIDHADLTALLFVQGYRRAEFIEA